MIKIGSQYCFENFFPCFRCTSEDAESFMPCHYLKMILAVASPKVATAEALRYPNSISFQNTKWPSDFGFFHQVLFAHCLSGWHCLRDPLHPGYHGPHAWSGHQQTLRSCPMVCLAGTHTKENHPNS